MSINIGNNTRTLSVSAAAESVSTADEAVSAAAKLVSAAAESISATCQSVLAAKYYLYQRPNQYQRQLNYY